ncbi:hypothetical protein [Pandoraea sp. SD6-2]|uniref:hypothetical protein n=1 Tax=Pandoraea sp. SD6-2 TaxID=1286093 RepID=UPI00032E3F4B|nr:hypothetical protein [Pandoraea sp. SD6-2]EON11949.1 hypothetical protein C266_19238 [Pandoraea sp. SD6-2]
MPDLKTVTFDAIREAVGRITEVQRRSGGPAWMEAKGLLANDLTFIAQGLIDALAAAAAPAAQSAGQEAVASIFACYLIDHCEGETITEEQVQRWLAAMLANPQYAAPVNASEPVDMERIRYEGWCEGWSEAHKAKAQEIDKDAARYRWLRDEFIGDDPDAIGLDRRSSRGGLDVAIDLAIEASKGKHHV